MLTVIDATPRPIGAQEKCKAFWTCLCDCGNTHVVHGGNLRSGDVKSCGCLKRREYLPGETKAEHEKRLAKEGSRRFYYKDITASRKRMAAWARHYAKTKPELTRARQKRTIDKRLRNDPVFKLLQTLRGRVGAAIKKNRGKKAAKTMDLIGCSVQYVRAFLEKQFQPGMTWENHGKGSGKWHIDHIKPCAAFDLSDEWQQRYCFHYTNLQPLWGPDNIRKGAKWPI